MKVNVNYFGFLGQVCSQELEVTDTKFLLFHLQNSINFINIIDVIDRDNDKTIYVNDQNYQLYLDLINAKRALEDVSLEGDNHGEKE